MEKLAPLFLILAACALPREETASTETSSAETSHKVVSVNRSAQPVVAEIGYEAPLGERLLVMDETDVIRGILEVKHSGRERSTAWVVAQYPARSMWCLPMPSSHWWLESGLRVFNPLTGVSKVWLVGEPRSASRGIVERWLQKRYGASLVDRPEDGVLVVVLGELKFEMPECESEEQAAAAIRHRDMQRAKAVKQTRAVALALGAIVIDERVFWDLIAS